MPTAEAAGTDRNSRVQCALGFAIRSRRERNGQTRQALAQLSSVSRNYLGALERGEANPSFETLNRLCVGLSIPLSELVIAYETEAAQVILDPPVVDPARQRR